jgi:hypothetical protein
MDKNGLKKVVKASIRVAEEALRETIGPKEGGGYHVTSDLIIPLARKILDMAIEDKEVRSVLEGE